MNPPVSVVLHGHFYQPPREDPRTGRIPRQRSAEPFHDWNERIEAECYGPVVSAPVLGEGGAEVERINALEWMSFDFGPTLLEWMESAAPETYRAVIEADRASVARLGHGNAMAMAYHHPILPLSDPRDRLTEIRWGIADFRRRFGRDPEGMWLPETAIDAATLDAVAAEGISFTVVAPGQVVTPPPDGRPGRYTTASGAELAIFVYDGPLSHGVAFGELLSDGVAWAGRMSEPGPALRSIAADGETFGHHHVFADLALARVIYELRGREGVALESYASFLAREGMGAPVQIVEPSAWSCAHGVGRWSRDCGCAADPWSGTHQRWRAPFRAALEWLAEELHRVFEEEARPLLRDPWAARDAFGAVVASTDRRERVDFVRGWLRDGGGAGDEMRSLELLEMERNALRLFTSCAWFFDDIARLEPLQVLRYADRALDLARGRGGAIREGFTNRLRSVESNDPTIPSAAELFLDLTERPERIGAF